MSIVFYEAPMSSATPVACALAELEVPHERVRFDLSKGDQFQPSFLEKNPNGKVPTLVVDGTPMFEGLAIMIWLGEHYGVDKKLWPKADSPANCQAMAWSVWAYVTYASALQRYFFSTSQKLGPTYHNAAQAAYTKKELDGLLRILDARLGAQPYMLGEAFTLVDLIVASAVGYGAFSGVGVSEHPHVEKWLKSCQGRPSFRSFMGV